MKPSPTTPDLDERVARLERVLERIIAAARSKPMLRSWVDKLLEDD
jgi:hypothetical protein